MLRRTNRGFAILIVAALLLLPFVFASMPRGSDSNRSSFIVKRGTKVESIANALESDGYITSRFLFLISSYVLHKGRVMAGEYELSKDMSPIQIARKMANGERKVYTLKIVEGQNMFTIADVIEKAGIMDGRSFLDLAREPEFLSRVGIPADSLEGYLAPDTYFFSKETDVDEFLEKIVQRTFKFFQKEDIKNRMQEVGMTSFEVLSLASIIEKEARLETEKTLISAVFHNRLRVGMSLDADPTVIYGAGSFNRDLKKADLMAETPYNTYRFKGLPKGPICNPSKGSIMAALYPDESDALYFVSKNDGSHVFSRTTVL
jgi:UPF0755 protein